jgi:hypothetical protein
MADPLEGDSSSGNTPGVKGTNAANGDGVVGTSATGTGVRGASSTSSGFIAGIDPIFNQHAGVFGQSDQQGVFGEGNSDFGATGVFGHSSSRVAGFGVRGEVAEGTGVQGQAFAGGTGVNALSQSGVAIHAESQSNSALTVTTHASNIPAFFINHLGTGDMMVARDANQAEVFRVLGNGDVQVRGVLLTSDCRLKTNFADVSTRGTLERLLCMPISSWNYRSDPDNVRHIGPTSQDFQAAFGFNGENEQQLSSVDVQGVALAAIQGLNAKLEAENVELRRALARLESRLSVVESAQHRRGDTEQND